MTALPQIKKVWIEDSCLISGTCEACCPEVFELFQTKVELCEGAEQYFESHREQILEAQRECIADAIKVEFAEE